MSSSAPGFPAPRRALRTIAIACVLGAVAFARPVVAAPGWRLDPSERERLRDEVREQGREGRFRGLEPRPGYGGAPPPGHEPPAGYGAPPRGYGPGVPGHPPMPPGPSYGPARAIDAPAWGPPPHGRQRMSPEDREQLRMQLRERRHSRD